MTDPTTETRHPGGRPLLFDDVEELKARIDAYFVEMDREEDTRIFLHEKSEAETYDDMDSKGNLMTPPPTGVRPVPAAPPRRRADPRRGRAEEEAALHDHGCAVARHLARRRC